MVRGRRLTEILRGMGLIDEQQISMALKRQHMIGARIGTQLVHLGFINEDQLAEGLSRLYGVPAFTTDMLERIDDDATKLITREAAEKHRVLPVRKTDKAVTVAMINPGDLELIQDLEFRMGRRLEVLVCPEVTMERGLHLHYGIEPRKEYVTLLDERGRVHIQQHASELLRGSFAPHVGFRDLSGSFVDNPMARAAYEMGLADDARGAVSCVVRAAKRIVQRADLYLIRRSEGALRRWNTPGQGPERDHGDSMIPLSQVSGLIKEMEKKRFYFGDRSSLPEPAVADRFSQTYAKKVLFVPAVVDGMLLAFLYADNAQRNMTGRHVEDLLGLSSLLPLALRLNKSSSTR